MRYFTYKDNIPVSENVKKIDNIINEKKCSEEYNIIEISKLEEAKLLNNMFNTDFYLKNGRFRLPW